MILPGGIIGGAVPSITQTDTGSQNVSQSSFTFSSASLGLAGRRHIAVAAGWFGGLPTITSATIAGVSATTVAAAGSVNRSSGIVIAPVPTGITGDVVINFSANAGGCFIAVYALYNLKSATAVDTATFTNTSGSDYFLDLSANVSARGVVVGVFTGVGVTTTPTPTGLSNETVLRNVSGNRVYSSDYTATLAETPRSMGWTLNGGTAGSLATFR